jgi:regulator of sigma E protease
MPFVVISILSTLIVLGIMVLVHEFGHFAMAKLFQVKVEVFSIGFGKRLFGFRRGDTDYRLSLLPLGGYVKMQGELGGDGTVPLETTVLSGTAATGDAPRDSGDLNAKPRWQRILIALAGPVANFILALVLMTGLYMMHNEVDAYRSKAATIDFVAQNTPAANAGLKAGDRIVHFDTRNDPTWDDVWVRVEVNLGQKVPVTVLRDGERVNTTLAVTSPRDPDDFSIGSLGIVPLMQPTPVVVHAVTSSMPAAKAGLKAGDKVLSLNGVPLHSVTAMLAFLQQNHDAPVTMKVQSGNTVHELQVTPMLADNTEGSKSYQMGFEAEPPPF